MDERNANRLTPPAVDRRNDGAQLPEPERLTTADLAAAGGATDAPAQAGSRGEPGEPQVEHVEAARTERVPAPETRIEPGAMRNAAASSPPASKGDEQGARPAEPPASPVSSAPTPAASAGAAVPS